MLMPTLMRKSTLITFHLKRPTRIIYLIATNYIFGFDKNLKNDLMKKHFKQIDAAKYAKEGTLEEVVQQEFGEE